MDNPNDLPARIEAARWNQPDPLPEITWRIDPAQTVQVDLAATLREAVEFNQWEGLLKSPE